MQIVTNSYFYFDIWSFKLYGFDDYVNKYIKMNLISNFINETFKLVVFPAVDNFCCIL